MPPGPLHAARRISRRSRHGSAVTAAAGRIIAPATDIRRPPMALWAQRAERDRPTPVRCTESETPHSPAARCSLVAPAPSRYPKSAVVSGVSDVSADASVCPPRARWWRPAPAERPARLAAACARAAHGQHRSGTETRGTARRLQRAGRAPARRRHRAAPHRCPRPGPPGGNESGGWWDTPRERVATYRPRVFRTQPHVSRGASPTPRTTAGDRTRSAEGVGAGWAGRGRGSRGTGTRCGRIVSLGTALWWAGCSTRPGSA